MCHKICESDNDCTTEEPKCVEVTFFQGDAAFIKYLCFASSTTTSISSSTTISPVTTSVVVVNPGECPNLPNQLNPLECPSSDQCTSDGSCSEDEKCCDTLCVGRICKKACVVPSCPAPVLAIGCRVVENVDENNCPVCPSVICPNDGYCACQSSQQMSDLQEESPDNECRKFGLNSLGRDDFNENSASQSAQLVLVKSSVLFNVYRCVVQGTALMPPPDVSNNDIDYVTYCGDYNSTLCSEMCSSSNSPSQSQCTFDSDCSSSEQKCCSANSGTSSCQPACPVLKCPRSSGAPLGPLCKWERRYDSNGCWLCPKVTCSSFCEPSDSVVQNCNTCACTGNGRLSCTERPCVDNQNSECYNEFGNAVSELVPQGEGCVSCTCSNGGSWSCTQSCGDLVDIFRVKNVIGLSLNAIKSLLAAWAQNNGGQEKIYHIFDTGDGRLSFFVSFRPSLRRKQISRDTTLSGTLEEYLTSSDGVTLESVSVLSYQAPPVIVVPQDSGADAAVIVVIVLAGVLILVIIAVIVYFFVCGKTKQDKTRHVDDIEFQEPQEAKITLGSASDGEQVFDFN